MIKKHAPEAKHDGGHLLRLALGAALATAAGYVYVTHKEDIDKEAKKRFDQLAKKFRQSKPEIEKRVKEVWGEVSKNAISTYLDLRAMLLKELEEENMKRRGDVFKQRYEEIVDKVVIRARKSGMLTPHLEKQLARMFKMDWTDIEKMLFSLMMTGARKTREVVKKIKVSGKARKVAKTVKRAAKKSAKKKR